MKTRPHVFSKIDIKRIILYYFIALVPLLLYGLYKNGIMLYQKDLINLMGLFKPLLISLIGLFIGYGVEIINAKLFKKDMKESIYTTFYGLYGVLISFIIFPNINYLNFIIITFISLLALRLLNNKIDFKCNIICLVSLLLIAVSYLTKSFDYKNAYEVLGLNISTLKSLFFGQGIGGINSTSVILIGLGYLFLGIVSNYKAHIPLCAITSYFILLLIYYVYKGSINDAIINLFTNNFLFIMVFIAPIYKYSPITLKGKMMFGILIGVLTFVLGLFIHPAISSLIVIFVLSIFVEKIDKIWKF